MYPEITLQRALLIVGAGGVAGFINSIVGSGTLVSFPALVGIGYADKLANMINSAGLFPGSLSAVAAQKTELEGQRRRLLRLVPASLLGGVVGAILLLHLPEKWFSKIVPFLILLGVGLVIIGPSVQKRVRKRRDATATKAKSGSGPERLSGPGWLALTLVVFVTGIYGGYFGAGQGIILTGVLGMFLDDTIQRLNATKNVLAAGVNAIAAVVFVVRGHLVWSAIGLIAVGSVLGGQLGARAGRKIQPVVLRSFIVVIGLAAATKLLLN